MRSHPDSVKANRGHCCRSHATSMHYDVDECGSIRGVVDVATGVGRRSSWPVSSVLRP